MRSLLGRFHRPFARNVGTALLLENNLGDGSTLSLDFTTGVLDPRITFTRSTTGTYINSNGFVATMAAAPTNDPTKARFDYDPSTLTPRGLLIEGSSQNLLTYSEAFTPSWTDTNITRNSTTATSPRNVNDALQVTANAGNATIIRSSAIGSSAERTFSIWLRRNSGFGSVQYTTDNGTAWTTQAITSTWTRYVFAATTANQQVGIRIVSIGDSIELWGAQLEAGSGATSYIPTVASATTRAADACTMPVSTFITGNPYPQTLFVDCIPNTASGSFLDLIRLIDRSTTYGTQIYYYNAATMSASRKTNASASDDRSFFSGLTYGSRHKIAVAIDSSSFIGSRDGSTAAGPSTAPNALTSTVTHLGIGCDGNSSAANFAFATYRQIKFWPYVLSQAQLNSATTL